MCETLNVFYDRISHHFTYSYLLNRCIFFLMIPRTPISTLFPYPTLFFFNDTATTEIYTLSLHDALQISYAVFCLKKKEHTSELQSRSELVCRLLLEKTQKHNKS